MCICVLGQGSELSKDKNTGWLVKDLSDSQGSLRGGTADGAHNPSDIQHLQWSPEDGLGMQMSEPWECPPQKGNIRNLELSLFVSPRTS